MGVCPVRRIGFRDGVRVQEGIGFSPGLRASARVRAHVWVVVHAAVRIRGSFAPRVGVHGGFRVRMWFMALASIMPGIVFMPSLGSTYKLGGHRSG